MSLQQIRRLHAAISTLRRELAASRRDWTALSIVPGSSAYAATVKALGEENVSAASSFFARARTNSRHIPALLKKKSVPAFDPFSGTATSASKSVIYRKYQFYFFYSGDEPAVIACLGSRPLTLFYLERKVWIDLRPHSEPHYHLLGACVATVHRLSRPFFRYLAEAEPVETALVVGDERPTHFIRESLGGIQDFIDRGKIDQFWRDLDYLIVPLDYTFIPPDDVFDIPPRVRVVHLPLQDVNRFAASKNLFVCRLMRSGNHMSESLRQRLVDYGTSKSAVAVWPEVAKTETRPSPVTVWFGVEAEKGRLRNQEEVFDVLASVLSDRFGDDVRLIIDGWSPAPYSLSKKDTLLFSTIRRFVADGLNRTGIRFPVIESFTMPYRDKIALARKTDFFVTMHGSAALVPSLLCQKPGITYHSAFGVGIDLEVWTEGLYRAQTTDLPREPGWKSAWEPFRVEPDSLRETIHRLIDEQSVGASG